MPASGGVGGAASTPTVPARRHWARRRGRGARDGRRTGKRGLGRQPRDPDAGGRGRGGWPGPGGGRQEPREGRGRGVARAGVGLGGGTLGVGRTRELRWPEDARCEGTPLARDPSELWFFFFYVTLAVFGRNRLIGDHLARTPRRRSILGTSGTSHAGPVDARGDAFRTGLGRATPVAPGCLPLPHRIRLTPTGGPVWSARSEDHALDQKGPRRRRLFGRRPWSSHSAGRLRQLG